MLRRVTDEEETGGGQIAAVARGVRADAGLVPEPTSFDAVGRLPWRRDLRDRGHRPARARGDRAPAGEAVNAIDKARLVMNALRRLHDDRACPVPTIATCTCRPGT